MKEKETKNMPRKLTAAILAASLTLSGLSLTAFAQDTKDSKTTEQGPAQTGKIYDSVNKQFPKTFSVDGYHLYDICPQEDENHKRADLKFETGLMQQTILSRPYNQDDEEKNKFDNNPTLLKEWANIACGIFAGTPSSYRSYGDEDSFGEEKSEQIFKNRFMHDVSGKLNSYGNLSELLAKEKEGKQRTEANRDDDCYKDIVTKNSGILFAENMNSVQNNAFNMLRKLNGLSAAPEDFSRYASLKGMEEDKGNNPCLYTMVATRDRQGLTFCYDYNLFGLVFYDFNLHKSNDGENDLVFSALTKEQKEELKKQMEKDADVVENTYRYSDKKSEDINSTATVNHSNSILKSAVSLTKSSSVTEQISETSTKNYKMNESVSFNWTHNTGSLGGGLNLFSNQFGVTVTVGSEQSWGSSETETKSKSKTEQTSETTQVDVPPHCAQYLKKKSETKTTEDQYDQPVMISYKVAVFSLNGRYYDDGLAINSFCTAGYGQRAFFTEIGSRLNDTGAWYNLKQRSNGRFNADNAVATTKLVGQKHAYNHKYNWDTPFISKLDWGEIKKKANNIDLNIEDSIATLTTYLPISLTGGTLTITENLTKTELGEFVPTRQLKTVQVAKAEDESVNLLPGQSLNLSRIQLQGLDEDQVPFFTFTPGKGRWELIDENGNPINNCDLGVLSRNSTGEYIFKANQNTVSGKVFAKYFVEDNYYKYYVDGAAYNKLPTVSSKDVNTQVIEINCKSLESTFDGTIETPKEIVLLYQPGTAVNLTEAASLKRTYLYDSKGNQLKVQPNWQVKEESDCELKENWMTIHEDGDYHIRFKYGSIYSDWVVVHAKADHSSDSELLTDSAKAVDYEDAAAALYETVLKNQSQDLELPDSIDENLQNMDPCNKNQAFELAANQNLFSNQTADNVNGTDLVSVKDLALFMYTLRDQFGIDDEIEAPQGFDELMENAQVSWRHLPALKWAMANGLDLSDLNRSVNKKETVQFMQNCLNQIAEEQANPTYLELD